MYIYDLSGNGQARAVCGNDVAASVKEGGPFHYQSIFVMETCRAKLDADGRGVKDSNGPLRSDCSQKIHTHDWWKIRDRISIANYEIF